MCNIVCVIQREIKMRYDTTYKLKVLEYAEKYGSVRAAKMFALPSKTILRWNDLYHVYEKRSMRTFTDAQRKEILEYANAHGLTSAMREYNINISTILKWNSDFNIYVQNGRRANATHKKKLKRFDLDTKLEILNFAKEHGISNASRKYNVPSSTIQIWNEKLKVYNVRKHREFSSEEKQAIIEFANQTSFADAAKEFNLYSHQIYKWKKDLEKKK